MSPFWWLPNVLASSWWSSKSPQIQFMQKTNSCVFSTESHNETLASLQRNGASFIFGHVIFWGVVQASTWASFGHTPLFDTGLKASVSDIPALQKWERVEKNDPISVVFVKNSCYRCPARSEWHAPNHSHRRGLCYLWKYKASIRWKCVGWLIQIGITYFHEAHYTCDAAQF